MTTHSTSWLESLKTALTQSKEVPLWGHAPSLAWDRLSHDLSAKLKASDLRLSLHKTEWKTAEELVSSQKCSVTAIEMAPLDGKAYWVLPHADLEKLTAALLVTSSVSKGFSDPRFIQGFYQYLLLETLDTIETMQVFPDLKIRLTEESQMPKEPSLVFSVSIEIQGKRLWGSLVISSELRHAFQAHYKEKRPDFFSQPLAEQISLNLHLNVGSCSLSQSEWQHLNVGDYIILDRCTYDPSTQKGSLSLQYDDLPLFRARIKKNSLKILDYAFYQEEGKPMSDELNPEQEEPMEAPLDEEPFVEGEEEYTEEEEHMWASKNEESSEETVEKMISSHEIPLNVVVEIDRIKINLDKLLQLKPGNVLELSVRPEQGVYLTINGKKVAKAELLKIGEAFGVKILQIGEPSGS